MSVLELNDEQVISIVRQLPAARKRAALLALAQDAQARREERIRFGEAQLLGVCPLAPDAAPKLPSPEAQHPGAVAFVEFVATHWAEPVGNTAPQFPDTR